MCMSICVCTVFLKTNDHTAENLKTSRLVESDLGNPHAFFIYSTSPKHWSQISHIAN
jgi:hypothetical protein